MGSRWWFVGFKAAAKVSWLLAHVRLYGLCFWFTGLSIHCLDKYDGGYPQD